MYVCVSELERFSVRKNCVFNRGNKSISITCVVSMCLKICVSMNFDHTILENQLN